MRWWPLVNGTFRLRDAKVFSLLCATAKRDGGLDQFSRKPALCELGCSGFTGSRNRRFAIKKNQNRRPCATESRSQNSCLALQLLHRRKQRAEWSAIGLMNAVFQRCAEQIRTALR